MRLPALRLRDRLSGVTAAAAATAATANSRANLATALGVAGVLAITGAGAAAAVTATGSGVTHVTVHFTRAIDLYRGSGVRVLGVKIGKIDSITPEGKTVAVRVELQSGVKVPADATATIVPPALVSDRYIQLSVYRGGPVMPDDGDIPVSQTQIPVEKDQILQSLDNLDQALGPNGANANGSLSQLIKVGAANLNGNGAQINQTLRDLTTLVGTLDDNKSDLTGTVTQLDTFTNILLKNDGNIKALYTDLSSVSAQLSDDRQALAAAFANLATATKELGDLAVNSRTNLKGSVQGLVDITNTLVQDKASLEEVLDTAPLALSNLAGAFDPSTQTLDVRTNTALSDQNGLALLLCTGLQTSSLPAAVSSAACNAISSVPTGAVASSGTGSSGAATVKGAGK